jgi:dipeptidase E
VRLYLSSAGVGDHPERLVEVLRGGRRAAVIANALDRSPELRGAVLAEELAGLRRLGLDARELDLRRDPTEALSELHLVWACGGNVFELRRALAASGADEAIARDVRADRIVYGGNSAGACVLAPSLRGLETVDDPGDQPRYDGLGLIGFAIVPHCSAPGRPGIPECDRLAERYRADGVPHRALHDGQALVIDGEGGDCPRPAGTVPDFRPGPR